MLTGRKRPIKRNQRPIKRVRSGGPRRGPKGVEPEKWRNASYRTWLRKNGMCEACLRQAFPPYVFHRCVEFCHGPVNGTGSKGPDAGAVPLCPVHHRLQHKLGWPAFEKKYQFSREKEAALWWARFKKQS